MQRLKVRHLIMLVLLCALMGCSSIEPRNERSWDDFIPGEPGSRVNPVADPGKELQPLVLSNNKIFPDDCDFEDLARVVDGDTLVLEDDMRVRFIGIDTPETKHPGKAVEPFGVEASALTKDLLASSNQVCLIASKTGDSYDKYGRRLAYVFSEYGVDINAELLRSGLAKGYFNFPFDRKSEFQILEKKAQEERRGIWSQ